MVATGAGLVLVALVILLGGGLNARPEKDPTTAARCGYAGAPGQSPTATSLAVVLARLTPSHRSGPAHAPIRIQPAGQPEAACFQGQPNG